MGDELNSQRFLGRLKRLHTQWIKGERTLHQNFEREREREDRERARIEERERGVGGRDLAVNVCKTTKHITHGCLFLLVCCCLEIIQPAER